MINTNCVNNDYFGDDKMELKYKTIIPCKMELVVSRVDISKGPYRVGKDSDQLTLDLKSSMCVKKLIVFS